jgi:hypothetical protein
MRAMARAREHGMPRKLQAPSSKLQRNFKFQARKGKYLLSPTLSSKGGEGEDCG